MRLSRREFSKMLCGAAAIGLVDLDIFSQITDDKVKLSMRRLATRSATGEGLWTDLKIEGKLPKELNGSLFRTAPGESERFGVTFRHLFDGDAYFAGWNIRDGKASLRGRYIPSAQRRQELQAGRMIFGEYGTPAPGEGRGSKNQPSVNVVKWRGKLLGLSEGAQPTIVDPETFDHEGYEDFGGAAPDYLTFTAHPRFDPETGDMYAFGFEKRPPGTLHVIHVSHETGKAETLYKLPQTGFNMVHDAFLTENYFVIPILSTFYDMSAVMKGQPMGEALRYAENKPSMLYAFPRETKEGKAEPVAVELPPHMIYHYGNAYEAGDKLVFEAIAYNDGQFFEFLQNWRTGKTVGFKPPRLKTLTVDLKKKTLAGSDDLAENVEFPRYDLRFTGRKARYLYAADKLYDKDAAIIRIDLEKKSVQRAPVGKNRTVAEPVFVPKTLKPDEDKGWILAQGFDAGRDENFLLVLDAQTLEFEARVRANGQRFPLGFHGNFYSA
jgi:all-trans-8'-apo-beta-carotenal 15,15'-oxygenase